jgi:single stranded DNA-binding protein
MNNSGINKVFLLGNIAREPRSHKTEGCPDMLCFTLLTRERLVKNGVLDEHCEYHNIKIQVDKVIDVVALKAGMLVYIKGKIKTTPSTDTQNIKRYRTEIIGEQIQVIFNLEMATAKESVLV